MPTESISPYVSTVINQNIAYALPAMICQVVVSAGCETSINGTTWIPFVSGSETGAIFIRCPGGIATVVCKPVMAGVGGSGAPALPTAPLGQVMISQGVGVQPIFSDSPLVSQVKTADAIYASYLATLSQGEMRAVIIYMYPRTFAGFGAGENVGDLVNISDSTVNTPGATIVGGGSFNVLARWNGTVWKVVA